MGQFPCVGNFALTYRAQLIGCDGDDGGGLAGEGGELYFVGLIARIDVDDDADVAGFETFIWEQGCQNDPVVFVDHGWSDARRVGCDKSGCGAAAVDDPNGADGRDAAIGTKQRAVEAVFDAVQGIGD